MSVTTLGQIVAHVRDQLRERQHEYPIDRVVASAPTPGARRPFARALAEPGVRVIAEFKRRSPSRGVIREDLHPVRVAQAYEVGGAAALSVLTEPAFFGGCIDDLQQARAATSLPVLRKDFVVDAYQVHEAWVAGADAVLLIVAVLSDAELGSLMRLSSELGVAALVEVHDRAELDRALRAGARLVGVNNRDLRTMQVHLETGLALAEAIPDDVVAVAESGLGTGAELRRFRDAGYDAFLIGEHLMRAPEPGAALEALVRDAGGEA